MSINRFQEAVKTNYKSGFIPTGFSNLDSHIIGYEKGNLYIMGSRPGMGKTTFLINSFLGTTQQNVPSCFVSLLARAEQIANKIISKECGINESLLRASRLSEFEQAAIEHKRKKLDELPIYIWHEPRMTFCQFEQTIANYIKDHNVSAVFLDDLHQFVCKDRSDFPNREQEVSENIRNLKRFALEQNVAVIATSELNRYVESRAGDKKPRLMDLRDSGAIEDVADVIMFLYRGEYYKITMDEMGRSLNGIAEILGAKNRYGDEFYLRFKFNGRTCNMEDEVLSNDMDDPFARPLYRF